MAFRPQRAIPFSYLYPEVRVKVRSKILAEFYFCGRNLAKMQVRRIERCTGDVTVVAPMIQESFNPSKEFFDTYYASLQKYKQPKAPAGIYVMFVDEKPIGSLSFNDIRSNLFFDQFVFFPHFSERGTAHG